MRKCRGCFLPGTDYPEESWQLSPGDRIFLYTDGINEAQGSDDIQFGTDRMLKVLNEKEDRNEQELCDAMRDAVDAFLGDAPQFDDMTMLCLTFRGRGVECVS